LHHKFGVYAIDFKCFHEIKSFSVSWHYINLFIVDILSIAAGFFELANFQTNFVR
jgi:hypothetical protein